MMRPYNPAARTRNVPFAVGLVTGIFVAGCLLVLNRLTCDHSTQRSGPLLKEEVEGDPRACVPAAYPMKGPESPYHLMKVLPPPAECKIQGFTIEELEPKLNFRRPYTLGYSYDVETKIQVLPYMRATQDAELRSRQRRVFLDLGGKEFDSSTSWFLHWYPLDFTEVHVFEAVPDIFFIPKPTGWSYPELLQTLNNASRVHGAGTLPVPDWALQRIKLHNKFVTVEDKPATDTQVASINITRFMLDELLLLEDDAVIVKMDIDGAEWNVLPAWLKIPRMPFIVDEIWVEIHYNTTTMARYHWLKWEHSRDEAYKLLKTLRDADFFIHPWP